MLSRSERTDLLLLDLVGAETRFRASTRISATQPMHLSCADCKAAAPLTADRTLEPIPESRFPRKGGTRRVRPAIGFFGSPGMSHSSPQPVPWFHENALLRVDGRGVGGAEDRAGLRCWRIPRPS